MYSSDFVLSKEDPAYLSYYYSNENAKNVRLPPPTLSREDWRVAQRFGDMRRREKDLAYCDGNGNGNGNGDESLFSLEQDPRRSFARQPSAEWLERDTDGLIGLAGVGFGARSKSLADMLQEGLVQPTSVSGCLSRPASHGSFENIVGPVSASGPERPRLSNEVESVVARFPCPRIPSVGGKFSANSNSLNGLTCMEGITDVADTLAGLNLSKDRNRDEDSCCQSRHPKEFDDHPHFLFDVPNGHNQVRQQQFNETTEANSLTAPCIFEDITDHNISKMRFDRQMNFPRRISSSSSSNLSKEVAYASLEGSSVHYRNPTMRSNEFTGYNPCGYSTNQELDSALDNHFGVGSTLTRIVDGQSRGEHRVGSGLQVPDVNPLYIQYLQKKSDYSSSHGAGNLSDLSFDNNSIGTPNVLEYQKAYVETYLAQQKQQYAGKSCGLNHEYYANSAVGLGMRYPGSLDGNECFSRRRIPMGGSIGSWHLDNGGHLEESYPPTLLEEFKNNKTRCLELSEIVGHVGEFSVDQYGSRFIQQKLEMTSVDEKNKIFPEIIPHARTLMIDVFGNYVIQKFFEHGTESQREELASQFAGFILPLSLQIYGCRVIQKALEVVDVDRQTQMVAELDGFVMKCVHDQNGNHVIQKCIECVPQDRIQFIISSLYGQVVALSIHPYGCRVIQRVLEHCDDMNTQRIVIEEILQSISTLAEDQYGNYVVQHILQHGKPDERSFVINKLAGHMVKMSQQKYASNVIEKCLTYAGQGERQIMVKEMLGFTDENEPLQVYPITLLKLATYYIYYIKIGVASTTLDKPQFVICNRSYFLG
ncbi:hypothetical protein GIB67_002965 [Kingdonia uniflora]|uniref:PUM-HD domain-containing protein n=1 Tax=Kingdonia uniflora TaxID=39325 RepID=A0A7J7M8S1_9MAGN|nr:hypothetical protein GIB67_002965 [Kingdonia uniflora]